MIKENSGKLYRIKLEHNFGFGFVEIYDFTDFYDLSQMGNLNLFVQLINTYYPIEKTEKLLTEIKN